MKIIVRIGKEGKETIYVTGRHSKRKLPVEHRHKLNVKRVLLGLTPNQVITYYHPEMNFDYALSKDFIITEDNRITS